MVLPLFLLFCIGQTHAAHPSSAARRPKGLGLHYEAHLRGLEMCNIYLTATVLYFFCRLFFRLGRKNNLQRRRNLSLRYTSERRFSRLPAIRIANALTSRPI